MTGNLALDRLDHVPIQILRIPAVTVVIHIHQCPALPDLLHHLAIVDAGGVRAESVIVPHTDTVLIVVTGIHRHLVICGL